MALEHKPKPVKKKTFMQNLGKDLKDGVKHALGFSPTDASSVGAAAAKNNVKDKR